jgi:hypothetical protein
MIRRSKHVTMESLIAYVRNLLEFEFDDNVPRLPRRGEHPAKRIRLVAPQMRLNAHSHTRTPTRSARPIIAARIRQ